jgi:hypothetical protein
MMSYELASNFAEQPPAVAGGEEKVKGNPGPIDAGISTSSSSSEVSNVPNLSESEEVSKNSSSLSNSSKEEALPPVYYNSYVISPTNANESLSLPLSPPACTACKGTTDLPAVANCFSCAALLCANCVIAHQLMVAFEGHHVTSLGTIPVPGKEAAGLSVESVRRMVKDSKKKLDELKKLQKSVDFTSSRSALFLSIRCSSSSSRSYREFYSHF